MKRSNLLIISLLAIFTSSIVMQAKPAAKGVELGYHIGAVVSYTETEMGNWGPSGLVSLHIPISDHIKTDFGLGMAKLGDGDFTTNVVPVRERFSYYPLTYPISPYISFGVGGTFYTVKEMPKTSKLPANEKDFIPFATAGIGITFESKEAWSFDLSGNFIRTFSNDLNAIGDKYDDSYIEILAGFRVVIDLRTEERVIAPIDNDLDDDGIMNSVEDNIGTDKNNPDTDADGLSDGKEVEKYKTDPLNADTDTDGLNDGAEVKDYKTDPLNADTDTDGLNDGAEVDKYKTNPLKADTDKDGLKDGEEVLTYKTDPLKADSDGEGLTDAEEVKDYKTNPLAADTDGGTIDDYTEVDRGTDPLNSEDDIIEEVFEVARDTQIALEGIVFNTESAEILPASVTILEKTLRTLQAFTKVNIEIQGYTDNMGEYDFNMDLSQKRADSVRSWLIDRGIDAGRITAKGFGPENPAASNDTREGRQKNRRIEFIRAD